MQNMSYPMPTLEDILSKLQDATTFIVLDLNQAYPQLKLDDEARKMSVINTPWGLYENLRLPFRLSSSQFIFQRFMDTMLADFPFAQAFLNDVKNSGKYFYDCYSNTCQVLEKFRSQNIKVKLNKCHIFATQVEYLGHCISVEGYKPLPKHQESVLKCPVSKNVTQLKSFWVWSRLC